MTISYENLFDSKQVDNVADDIIFSVSGNLFRKGRVRLINPTATAATIKLWVLPTSASTVGDDNCIFPVYSVAANSFIDVDLPMMSQGNILMARAGSATAITISQLDGFIQ